MSVEYRTITEISAALARREISSVSIVKDLFADIASRNQALNAVRVVSRSAVSYADLLDGERAKGNIRSALHGVPVLLKDAFPTNDDMQTTYGCRALENLTTSFDSTVVSDLRRAGAIIIGKCSCTDFGDYMSSSMPAEHSTTGGRVSNPVGPAYGRGGGSSTGCAAAVGVGFAPIAIGSEAQNSIQGPAANTGLVGFKPTVGGLKDTPEPSLVGSQTTAGPMGHSVTDVALVLNAIMKPTAKLNLTLLSSSDSHDAARPHRIGIVRRGIFGRPGMQAYEDAFEQSISALDGTMLKFIDHSEISTIEEVLNTPSSVFKTEFKLGIESLLAVGGVDCEHANLEDIIRYNDRNRQHAIPYGQDLLIAAQETTGKDIGGYKQDRARDIRLTRELGIDETLAKGSLDALVVPMDFAAKITGKAGYPVMTVPCGVTSSNLPFALSFIASAYQEKTLIRIGLTVEKLLNDSTTKF